MKALRKKYGKRPWIETPNAAWYRRQCGQVNAMRAILLNAVGFASYSQVQAIRSTPSGGAIDRAKKAMMLADAFTSQTGMIAKIIKDHPMPSPNPSAEK